MNLVAPVWADRFRDVIHTKYRERFALDAAIFRCVAAEGAGEIGVPEPSETGPVIAG